ncbi:MAG: hypothetical protein WAQ33_11910, partial [Gaiellaceae bacterium]
MAPLAKNGGPHKKSWTALAIAALFVMGFLAAVAFGDTGGGATTSSASTDTTTVSSSASTDTGTTSTTPTETTTTSSTTTTAPATTTTPSVFSPTISSDQADYAPGSTVTLTGAGWGPGEAVQIVVNDDVGQSWQYSTNVTADASGTFTNQFLLPTYFVATYGVTATGSSG